MNTLARNAGGLWIAAGAGVGTALGVVLGYASLGLAAGVVLGIAVACVARR
jgi:hypothetical protein